jgi:hypothetical protein
MTILFPRLPEDTALVAEIRARHPQDRADAIQDAWVAELERKRHHALHTGEHSPQAEPSPPRSPAAFLNTLRKRTSRNRKLFYEFVGKTMTLNPKQSVRVNSLIRESDAR